MKLRIFILFVIVGLALGRDPKCPEDDEDLEPFPHEDCGKFYQCDVGGIVHVIDCDLGLEFNPETLVYLKNNYNLSNRNKFQFHYIYFK